VHPRIFFRVHVQATSILAVIMMNSIELKLSKSSIDVGMVQVGMEGRIKAWAYDVRPDPIFLR
jgi:hypothetical protein